MRFIPVEVFADGSSNYHEKFLAYQYEHQATTLRFNLPKEYIADDFFYYVVFRFNNDQDYISRVTNFEFIVPQNVTKVPGRTEMTLFIKNIDEDVILTTAPISMYVERAEYNPTTFNEMSSDPNIQVWLDQIDALLGEVRRVDERIAALSNEDGVVEVIDARMGFSSLRLNLTNMESRITDNSNYKSISLGPLTIPTSAVWTQLTAARQWDSNAEYMFYTQVTLDVKATDTIDLFPNTAVSELDIGSIAETFDGYIWIFASAIPTAEVKFLQAIKRKVGN